MESCKRWDARITHRLLVMRLVLPGLHLPLQGDETHARAGRGWGAQAFVQGVPLYLPLMCFKHRIALDGTPPPSRYPEAARQPSTPFSIP